MISGFKSGITLNSTLYYYSFIFIGTARIPRDPCVKITGPFMMGVTLGSVFWMFCTHLHTWKSVLNYSDKFSRIYRQSLSSFPRRGLLTCFISIVRLLTNALWPRNELSSDFFYICQRIYATGLLKVCACCRGKNEPVKKVSASLYDIGSCPTVFFDFDLLPFA